MIIVSTQNSSDWSQAQVYRFAGESVLFQTPCVTLREFLIGEAPIEMVVEASMAVQEHEDAEVDADRLKEVYSGLAPFGDRERQVTFKRRGNHAQLSFEDSPVCEIDFSHNHIHLLREGGFANLVNVELVTGPAMMIVLATLKTYCLHASAVSTNSGVIAIVGESGTGKSTLAWQAGDGWLQLSDDILPILYDKNRSGVQLSPMFPQLKLDKACAQGKDLGEPNIDFLLRINPQPSKTIEFRPMSKSEGMLQFVRHTVAAKLFDARIMSRHTKFANYVATKVPMVEVSYPRDLLQLTELREQIVDYLATFKSTQKAG